MIDRNDVNAILYLSQVWPDSTADDILCIYQKFLKSMSNRQDKEIWDCLDEYVGYLLWTGQRTLRQLDSLT